MTGQTIAYLRVSTIDQNLARQEDIAEGADKVFRERQSGKSRQRPELESLMDYAREGDEVVVWSIDRLARNLIDLRQIVSTLNTKGVAVRFVKDDLRFAPGDNDPRNQLTLNLMGAFAEFERALMLERQAEGIAKAKAEGRFTGRPRVVNDEQVREARERIDSGVPLTRVARDLGISRKTLYKELANLAKSNLTI